MLSKQIQVHGIKIKMFYFLNLKITRIMMKDTTGVILGKHKIVHLFLKNEIFQLF